MFKPAAARKNFIYARTFFILNAEGGTPAIAGGGGFRLWSLPYKI